MAIKRKFDISEAGYSSHAYYHGRGIEISNILSEKGINIQRPLGLDLVREKIQGVNEEAWCTHMFYVRAFTQLHRHYALPYPRHRTSH
jgi:hypothetical protein